MKLISKSELFNKSSRALEGMSEEIRKDLGDCEQRRRRDHAALATIRTVQAQRRIQRPNL